MDCFYKICFQNYFFVELIFTELIRMIQMIQWVEDALPKPVGLNPRWVIPKT